MLTKVYVLCRSIPGLHHTHDTFNYSLQIRGSKDLVGFLFNDFLLLVRPKLFFPKAATPADLEPWGKNEFQMYRKVRCRCADRIVLMLLFLHSHFCWMK